MSLSENLRLTKTINEYYHNYLFRQRKTYLGISFLQNPNDAVTIIEILHEQDVDLIIETGTFQGASALFFASVMYQYRYNATDKKVRPFKIVTMDISPEAKALIERYPLLANYITFIHASSASDKARTVVNLTYTEMKPKNVFISLDGDHFARAVYDELVYYQNYIPNVGNYILVQDTRLSRKWHSYYCGQSEFDGPCNGPQEAVNWFLKNEGQGRFAVDPSKEYLFSTHHKGYLKRIAA